MSILHCVNCGRQITSLWQKQKWGIGPIGTVGRVPYCSEGCQQKAEKALLARAVPTSYHPAFTNMTYCPRCLLWVRLGAVREGIAWTSPCQTCGQQLYVSVPENRSKGVPDPDTARGVEAPPSAERPDWWHPLYAKDHDVKCPKCGLHAAMHVPTRKNLYELFCELGGKSVAGEASWGRLRTGDRGSCGRLWDGAFFCAPCSYTFTPDVKAK